jgi:hypothetical protein
MLTEVVSTFGACQVFLVMVVSLLGWRTGDDAGCRYVACASRGDDFSVP